MPERYSRVSYMRPCTGKGGGMFGAPEIKKRVGRTRYMSDASFKKVLDSLHANNNKIILV